ncbi:DUF4232 domain-containing protein [Actinoplanes sp. RD1]|uniref:DUF4232 domain-containing protein n=1 Tax=Actinoplanes sp. RD1 TaxID=3064538 RepID=UPI002740B123|nr:DUF4232 domain-containing protein [Actinoplanes sp. RD1]
MRVPVLAMVVAGIAVVASGSIAHAATAEAGTAGPCAEGALAVLVEDGGITGDEDAWFEEVRLTLTNTASEACRVEGPLGVRLTGPKSQAFAAALDVPASDGAHDGVVLGAGKSAHATVRVQVLPGAEDVWEPGWMRVRLAGTGVSLVAAWPEGLAITQLTAPLPGTGLPNSVGPLTAGA